MRLSVTPSITAQLNGISGYIERIRDKCAAAASAVLDRQVPRRVERLVVCPGRHPFAVDVANLQGSAWIVAEAPSVVGMLLPMT
jgi:hypothetical protein